jgi:hypothetical protein
MPLAYDDKGNKQYEVELLSAGGARRQFDTNLIIQRYEQRIAMTVMADFLTLGHDRSGSQALGITKTSLFQTALLSLLDSISDVVNTFAIPRLFKLNTFENLTDYPKLTHDDIEKANLDDLSKFILSCSQAGAITPAGDTELENYLREVADLPKRPDFTNSPQDPIADSGEIDDSEILDPSKSKPTPQPQAPASAIQKAADDRAIFIQAVRELRDAVKKGDKK